MKLTSLFAIAALIAIAPSVSEAHTVTIGYENAGPGSVTFWYGSYHDPADVPSFATEGSLTLQGVGPTVFGPTNVAFNLHTGIKPAGLIDGTTNFFTDNAGGLSPVQVLSSSLDAERWQGVTFSGLAAGTYQFTYVPIANPTATWAPWDQGILTNVVTLDEDVVNTVPEPTSMALFGLTALGFGVGFRRRRSGEAIEELA